MTTAADPTYQAKVHMAGPDEMIVESGGKVTILSGGTLTAESGASMSLPDIALEPSDIALAIGSIIVGTTGAKGVALDAKTSGRILVGDGTTIASVAVSNDATLAANGALTIANNAITTGKILDAAVTAAKLANGAGVAALLTAGLGGSVNVVKTDAATTTIVAANATKDRACLVLVTVTETYAAGIGTAPTVKIGEDNTIEKCMAATVLDTEVAGTVYAFAFTNTSTKKIIVTTTAAVGVGTGGCSITVLAIPTT